MAQSEQTENGAKASAESPVPSFTLEPIHGGAEAAHTVSLEPDLLSLSAPDGRLVMMLPRDEAVRHMRFNIDVLRGRTVSFVVVEGLKAYTFKCPPLVLRQLLGWLPQKPRAEEEEKVRRYGVVLILIGVVLLLFPDFFFRGWALALVVTGVADVLIARPAMYAMNAATLFFMSLVLLFGGVLLGRPVAVHPPEEALPAVRLLTTGLGSLLIVWSVQQMSLLGPVHRLRMAREQSHTVSQDVQRAPSRAVQAVALVLLLLGALFSAHLGWVAWLTHTAAANAPAGYAGWLLYAAAAGATLGAAAVLAARRFRGYTEGKVAGQLAVVLAVFYGAGLTTLAMESEASFSPYVLGAGVEAFVNVTVWAPLVALVILFNRAYTRIVEKELESQRF